MARRPRTILEACVRKHGIHKGAVTAAWVAQYAITTLDAGHPPTAREYAEYWAIDERNAFAHRARIKDVFGEKWLDVIEALAAEIDSRKTRSLSRVRSLPVPQT